MDATSLKTKSLLKVAKNYNSIGELVAFLDSNVEASQVADADSQFWPTVLKNYVHPSNLDEIILVRGDLKTSEDWKVLATDMSRGNAYMYSWYLDTTLGSSFFSPTFAVNQTTETNGEPTDVVITGTLPRSGTKTMCVQLWYPTGLTSETATFVCGVSHEDCITRAMRWLFRHVRHLDHFTSNEFGVEIDLSVRYKTEEAELPIDMFIQDILENDKYLDNLTKYNFNGQVQRKEHEVNFILSGVLEFPNY